MVSAVSAGTTLLTAFLLKLLFGSDDALLLTTYFVRPGATKTYQAKMAAIYVLMMNLIVCLAVGVGVVLNVVLASFSDDEDKVSYATSIACSVLLICYAVYLKFAPDDDDADDDDAEKGGDDVGKELLSKEPNADYGSSGEATQRYANPYVVFFLTGLDDAIVYMVLVIDDASSWYLVIFGAGAGTLLLVVAGYYVSTVRFMIDVIQAVPQWIVVVLLAFLILFGTIFDIPYM